MVLCVIVLVLYARIVLGGKTWDDVRYHTEIAPAELAASEAVLTGEAPTWWDGTGLGVPLLGEPSHGAAYPLTWLAATPHLLDLLAVLQLFWLALGVAVWARRLGAGELASVVAGALVAASGIAAGCAVRGVLPALAHVPWVGWATVSLATAATPAHARRYAALLGLALGAIGLTGSLAILVDALVLVIALGRRAQVRWLCAAILGGLAIAAAQWIPALAIAGDGTGATLAALKPSRLLELVLPGSFGAVSGEHAVAAIAGTAPALPSLFIGAPVFALAALAHPSRRMIGLSVTLAVLAVVVGRGGGWPAWLGAPELHLAVLAMVAASYAAVGIDALVGGERRALLAIGGGAVVTALGLGALAMLRSRAGSPGLDRALVDGAIALACAGGLFVVAWRWSEATWSSIAIAALLVAPSAGSLGVTAPATARDSVTRTPLWALAAAKARDKTNPAAPLRVYRPPRLYEEQHELTVAEAIATLTGAAAARFGLGAARSVDPARPPSHDQLWLSASSVGGALLERYGIQLAILPGAMEGRNLVELARRGQSALAQFPSAPPAAMVFEWVWVADDAAAIARLFPPGTSRGLPIGLAVLHGSGPDQQDEPRAPEPCTIIRWARGAIDLTCASQDASYAVVSSTNARGWTVEVNGADTPWVTADVMRRAVALPGGAHIVSWRYEAPGLVAGVTLAGLGVLGLLALLVWSLRVRREPSADEN